MKEPITDQSGCTNDHEGESLPASELNSLKSRCLGLERRNALLTEQNDELTKLVRLTTESIRKINQNHKDRMELKS